MRIKTMKCAGEFLSVFKLILTCPQKFLSIEIIGVTSLGLTGDAIFSRHF